MSRIKKRKAHFRNVNQKRRKKNKRSHVDDHFAMISANISEKDWEFVPLHVKQLYRFRAQQALSILTED